MTDVVFGAVPNPYPCPQCGTPVALPVETHPGMPLGAAFALLALVMMLVGGTVYVSLGDDSAADDDDSYEEASAFRVDRMDPEPVAQPPVALRMRCPPGEQIYDPDRLEMVSCAGPALAEMTYPQAEQYLSNAGYPIGQTASRCQPDCSTFRVASSERPVPVGIAPPPPATGYAPVRSIRGNRPYVEQIMFDYGEDNDVPPICVAFYPDTADWRTGLHRILGTSPSNIPDPGQGVRGCQPHPRGLSCRYAAQTAGGRSVSVDIRADRLVAELYVGSCQGIITD